MLLSLTLIFFFVTFYVLRVLRMSFKSVDSAAYESELRIMEALRILLTAVAHNQSTKGYRVFGDLAIVFEFPPVLWQKLSSSALTVSTR